MPIRVAEYIAKTVENMGTECAFLLSGGMMMHLMDALGRREKIKYYCNHHEQASAMAADAYARQSGKLGLCLATSGPGATNLLTGIVGAYQDSSPVLFLTGQCKRKETIHWRAIKGLRQCGFLEVDIIPIVESVTKYAAFVDDPRDIRLHLERAIHLATAGRPGPVLLDIPLDVQAALIDEDELAAYDPAGDAAAPAAPVARPQELRQIVEAMGRAKRPLILAGYGVRSAGVVKTFRQMVEQWQIPVVTSAMAKDILPYDHSLLVGHPGLRGDRAANFAVQCADVILTIGCSLHVQTTGYEGELFAPNALKIQIDVDAPLLEREQSNVQWKFPWDLKDYLPRLAAQAAAVCPTPETASWRASCQQWKERFTARAEPHVLGLPDDPSNLYEFIDKLSDALKGNETILIDAGQPFWVLPQAFRLKEGQRYLNAGSLAHMGFAIPAAIGAAAAAPGRPMVVIIGDGSLQTNIQELQTLAHHGFNVKIFVINNDGYASIRNTQRAFFNGHFVGSTPASGVTLPDTGAIAAAYRLPFVHCANRAGLNSAIAQALAGPGPMICEIMAQVDQKIMPAVPSYALADGTMKSKALHEMAPDIGVDLEALRTALSAEASPVTVGVFEG